MDRKGRQASTAFQDKFYYDYPSYKREERRDSSRPKVRRSDSSRSRREVSRSRDKEARPQPSQRSGSVKRSGRDREDNWHTQAPPQRVWSDREDRGHHQSSGHQKVWSDREDRGHRRVWSDREERTHHQTSGQQRVWSDREDRGHRKVWSDREERGPHQQRRQQDRRRWAWATAGDFDIINRNTGQEGSFRARNDYVDLSSMDTSSSSSSDSSVTTFSPQSRPGRSGQGLGYQKIYVRHSSTSQHSQSGAINRSKSISRPSPPRAKSVGNFPASRAQSFSSLYESSSRSVGNISRPLRTSLSSHGIFFTETGHVPRQLPLARLQTSSEAPLSMSLQDLQRPSQTAQHKMGRSLLDLSNVTINDSEIDKVCSTKLFKYY